MNLYLVSARYPGEVLDIREFVTPRSAAVLDLAECAKALGGDPIQTAWDITVCPIRYPEGEPVDYHYREVFLARGSGRRASALQPMFRQVAYEFFQMPFETLSLGVGDCDDTAIAAASVLRNFLAEDQVFCTMGRWRGFGHAWVTMRRDGELMVLETTRGGNACRIAFSGLVEGGEYQPWVRFNDRRMEVLRPEILEGVPPRQVLRVDFIGLHNCSCAKIDALSRAT